jgi:hypothetical protein
MNIPANELFGDPEAWGDDGILRWLRDAEMSNPETCFRKESMEDYRFYAGKQDSVDVLQKLWSQKRPATVYNEVKPKIDMLVGLAAQTKHEPHIVPTNAGSEALSEFMLHAMKHYRKKLKITRKELDCFEHTVKSGRSLLHFYIDKENPFEPQIKAKRFAGRDFYLDPQSTEYDMSDARFLILQSWLPASTLKARYPNFDISLYQAYVLGSVADLPIFFNEARNLYRLCEAWYTKLEEVVWFVNPLSNNPEWLFPKEFRVFAQACKEGFPMPDGSKKQFPIPEMLVAQKKFIWYRIFSGNITFEEGRSPYKFDTFPSVLYGAYRNEDTNAWFGHITVMKDPQRAVNTMKRQLSHLLQTLPKGILVHEAGAILNIDEYEQKSADPGFHMELAMNKMAAYKFEQQPQISPIYAQFSAECSQSMKDTSGIQNEMMGQETSSRTPGVTVHMRQETSLAVLFILYDNYRESRLTGDLILMNMIQQYAPQNILMQIQGPAGMQLLEINSQLNPDNPGYNDITAGSFDLSIDEVMETASQRQMVLQVISDYSRNNPGTIPADVILEYADVPYTVKTRIREEAAAQAEAAQKAADREYELELLKILAKVDATTADKIITEREIDLKGMLAQVQAKQKQKAISA